MVEEPGQTDDGTGQPSSPDRPASPRKPQTLRKWPVLLGLISAQTVLVFLIIPFLGAVRGNSYEVTEFSRKLDFPFILLPFAFACIVIFLQAAVAAPWAQANLTANRRPRLAILLASGMGLGLLCMIACVCLAAAVDATAGPNVGVSARTIFGLAVIGSPVLGTAATVGLRLRFRHGMIEGIGLCVASLVLAFLTTSLATVLLEAANCTASLLGAPASRLPSQVIDGVWLGMPVVIWSVCTPVVISFARRGLAIALLQRYLRVLLWGNCIVVAAALLMIATLQRRPGAHFSNQMYWAFCVCFCACLVLLGPRILIKAIRRIERIQAGLCGRCAYDMSGSREAQRCPECGNEWMTTARTG